MKKSILIFLFIGVVLFLVNCKKVRTEKNYNYKLKIISYIRTWELRKENGKRVFWKADDINGELLTDLNIAFAEIRNGSEIFISSTEWKDGFFDLFDQIAELKRKYPSLKANLSIGGWGVDGFSDVAYYENSRNAFVNNVMEWVEEYGFDGVDIDWEYPVNGANGIIKARPSDKTNFTLLMRKLRSALDDTEKRLNKKLTLSFAGGAFYPYLDWVEPRKISQIVDYVNLMTYDFYGEWSKTTGHHSNLFRSSYQEDDICVDKAVNYYLSKGFDPRKIVVGIPFFGKVWNGVVNKNNGLYQKFQGILYPEGIGYQDILSLENAIVLKKYWDESAKASFLYNGDIWISYDNEESIKIKIDYVKSNRLGGIMVWEYSHDLSGKLLTFIKERIKTKYSSEKR